MHALRAILTRRAHLPRITVAVVLLLALLSGVTPLSSASAGHLCTMACCAGLPPHAAGSCHMDTSPAAGKMGGKKTPEVSKLEPNAGPDRGSDSASRQEPDEFCGLRTANERLKQRVAAEVTSMKESAHPSFNLDDVTIEASDAVTDASSDQCNVNSQAAAQPGSNNAPSRNDSSESISIAAQSFSKPCPPECGTGAVSSNVRPSRPTAALAKSFRPQPSAPVSKFRNFNPGLLIASAFSEQVRPRGPPVNLS